MNDIRSNPTPASASDFHWPAGAELGYILASVLMPYLLAGLLLAA